MLLISFILSVVSAQMYDQQQLTHAGCVIFVRYFMNNRQAQIAEALQQIMANGISKEDGILAMQAAGVEQCIDKITPDETMNLMQGLQSQNIEFDQFNHLLDSVNFKKYGNNNKSKAKQDLLKIIGNIDDLINQQKKDYEAKGGKVEDLEHQAKKQKRKREKKQSSDDDGPSFEIPSIFDFKEYLVILTFFLVSTLLGYIVCFVPDNQSSEKVKISQE